MNSKDKETYKKCLAAIDDGDSRMASEILSGPDFWKLHLKAELVQFSLGAGIEIADTTLSHLLDSRSESVRWKTVEYISAVGKTSQFLSVLQPLSADPSSLVRDAVFKAFLTISRDPWTQYIGEFFMDRSAIVSGSILEAVALLAKDTGGRLPDDVLLKLKERMDSKSRTPWERLNRRRIEELMDRSSRAGSNVISG